MVARPALGVQGRTRTRGLAASVALATVLLTWAWPAHAVREDGAPASALGLADSVRSTASGATALYYNPAGMSGMRQFAVEAGYSYLDALSGHAIAIAAVDSQTNQNLAMGIGYNFITGAPGGVDRDGHNIRGALSTGYRGESWSVFVGVGARYLTLTKGAEDTAGNGETNDVAFFTMDAGLVFQFGSILRLGVSGQNLIDTKSAGEAPRRIGVGLAVAYEAFQLSADADLDLMSDPDKVTASFAFGAQYLISNMIVVRAGFALDGLTERNRFSVGLGYVSALVGVDAGYSRSTAEPGEDIISLGVKVFLP